MSPSEAAGKKIYDDMMCAGCHTIAGQGGEGGGALDDVGARRTRAELLDRMVKRRAGVVMPTLPPDMPTEKINDLVDYMLTLKGPNLTWMPNRMRRATRARRRPALS
jgi:mono/diheme cytochrome c family protein